MMQDIIALYANLIRAAFLPKTLPIGLRPGCSSQSLWKEPKQDIHLPWLPVCVRQVRYEIRLLVANIHLLHLSQSIVCLLAVFVFYVV